MNKKSLYTVFLVTFIFMSTLAGMMTTTQAARPQEFFIQAEDPISNPESPDIIKITDQMVIYDTFTITWTITDSDLEIPNIMGGTITQETETYVYYRKGDVAYCFSTFEIRDYDGTLLISGELDLIMRIFSSVENVQTTARFSGTGYMTIRGLLRAIGHSHVMRLAGKAW